MSDRDKRPSDYGAPSRKDLLDDPKHRASVGRSYREVELTKKYDVPDEFEDERTRLRNFVGRVRDVVIITMLALILLLQIWHVFPWAQNETTTVETVGDATGNCGDFQSANRGTTADDVWAVAGEV